MKPTTRPLFSRTGSIKPGRSVFDLSYVKKLETRLYNTCYISSYMLSEQNP
jgi:hypothetical protein